MVINSVCWFGINGDHKERDREVEKKWGVMGRGC